VLEHIAVEAGDAQNRSMVFMFYEDKNLKERTKLVA
jgi:hypothetical protein